MILWCRKGNVFLTNTNLSTCVLDTSVPTLYLFFYGVCDNAGAIERKEEKIANLDESLLKELAADDLEREEKEAQKLLKKKNKADNKARQRIKAQKKAENKKAIANAGNDDDDDDLNVSSFAKSNGKSKRK